MLVPGQRCTKKLSDIQTSHMIHVCICVAVMSYFWQTDFNLSSFCLQATARNAPDREFEINKIVCVCVCVFVCDQSSVYCV